MNSFNGIGRLTRDVELKKTGTGKSVVNFTVAINRRFGKDKDKADFLNCVAWNKTADFMANYLSKGALVSIEGRIETGSYEDNDGKRVYTTDVVVDNLQALESMKERNEYQSSQGNTPTQTHTQNKPKQEEDIDISSDDLPF